MFNIRTQLSVAEFTTENDKPTKSRTTDLALKIAFHINPKLRNDITNFTEEEDNLFAHSPNQTENNV